MADIELVQTGAVLHVRLARPEKKNALTDAMQRSIADALVHADAQPGIAVAVIEAQGRDFCAGNDLQLIRDMAAGAIRIEDLCVDHFLGALSGFRKPLLAGVRGRAIGVGATLLLHCDVVVVADDCRISFPFVDLSLVPEAASTYLLPARVGYARAYELLCLTEAVSGREAARIGLVTASVDEAALDDALSTYAERLAAKPAGALQATKRLMKDDTAIAQALARDQAMFVAQLKTLAPAPMLQGAAR